MKLLQGAEGLRHLAAHEGFEKIDDPAPVSKPQHRPQGVRGDRAGQTRAMGNGLIEKRQRIAHRAFRRARDEAKRLVLDRDSLLGADRSEVAGQHARIDATQIEPLAAGAHGDWNLFDLGCREHEFHVIGRLFQGFQKAVESLFGKHMHFVDDVDLCARHDRQVTHALDDFAHVVDPGMRGGVHFDDINMAQFDDRLAMHAKHRHMDCRARHSGAPGARGQFVIEGAGQDARRRRLADAAHPGQNIGLVDAFEVEGVRQRPDHGVLADQILEARGAVFAGKHAIGSRLCAGLVLRGDGAQSRPGTGFVVGVQRWFHATVRHRAGPLGERLDWGRANIERPGRPAGQSQVVARRAKWEAGQRPARSR